MTDQMINAKFLVEFESRLQSVLETFIHNNFPGIHASFGRLSHGPGYKNGQITIDLATESDGVINTPERTSFFINAAVLGLSVDDLGRTFPDHGKEYRIIGCSTRPRKFPVLTERLDTHKKYWFDAEVVKKALTAAAGEDPSPRLM